MSQHKILFLDRGATLALGRDMILCVAIEGVVGVLRHGFCVATRKLHCGQKLCHDTVFGVVTRFG